MENNEIKRLSGMLGLAMRAGRLMLGTDMICGALKKRGAVNLVLVTQEASAATKERLYKKCAFYEVPIKPLPIEMGELGRLLGKTYAPAAVAVTDGGFARELIRLADSAQNTSAEPITETNNQKGSFRPFGNGD